jgi:hypothetical protein
LDKLPIGFVIHCCSADLALAERLLRQLCYFHPDSPVLLLPDGISPDFAYVGHQHLISCPTPTTLKHRETIHQYSHRKLALASDRLDTDWIVQLDPDCYLSEPIPVPRKRVWHGRLFSYPYRGDQKIKMQHGAAWAMPREVVSTAAESNPFDPSDYIHDNNIRPDGSAMEDCGFAAGIAKVHGPKLWKNWSAFNGRRAAIHHPVKDPWAIPDFLLMQIAECLANHGVNTLLELGSGRSSTFLAALVDPEGLQSFHTIEHKPEIAEWVSHNAPGATVWHCPLDSSGWYDLSGFAPGIQFDAVLIDGPPANTPETALSRLPALERLRPWLSPGALLLLDDCDRPGEQKILTAWQQSGCKKIDEIGRITVLRVG